VPEHPAGDPGRRPGGAPVSLGAATIDAARWWELRRVPYNLALAALLAAWVVGTWPHFRGALTTEHVLALGALAVLANVCYCAAYVVDLPLQLAGADGRHRWRPWLWCLGMLFALVLEYYWIGDEIYPSVAEVVHR